MTYLIAALFFLSGTAALIYEIVWMRQLTLVFGVSTYAVSTILAVYMGGLAAGSFLIGRRADKFRAPLLLYAALEIAIGLYALIVPELFELLKTPYIIAYRSQPPYVLLTLFRASLAGLVLVPPTLLMGGTLPVLARFLVRRQHDIGRQTAVLYFVNTAGAVAGCMSAGFYLIEHYGLSGSTLIAASTNFVLAFLTIALHFVSRSPASAPTGQTSGPMQPETDAAKRPATRLVLAAIAISGFTSLANEVFWTRALVRFLYNSTYAFTTMLAVFLAGLAIGSLLYPILPGRKSKPILTFALLEIAAGISFILSAHAFAALGDLRDSQASTLTSFMDSFEIMVVRSGAILFAPALFFGATLPLATEICCRGVQNVGRTVGHVYAVNTAGAITGSVSASFLLIPALGMQDTLLALIATNILIGLALILRNLPRPAVLAIVAAAIALLPIGLSFALPTDLFKRTFAPRGTQLVFYQEGITDTVGVVEAGGQRIIHYEDQRGTAATFTHSINYVLGHLPALLHPGEPKLGLHICFGVGNSLSAMAANPSLTRVDSVELSPHVLAAAEYFWTNNNVIDNPKVHTIIEDGRNFVMATDRKYDVIGLEPPEIFTAGVINLYTREFYDDIYQVLNDDGVFLQWVPVGEGSLDEEKMLFRAFYDVFPHATVWQLVAQDGPILLIGTKAPLAIDYQLLQQKVERDFIRHDLAFAEINDADDILKLFIFGPERLRDFVSNVDPVTDDRTILDFSLPRHLGSGFGMGRTPRTRARILGTARTRNKVPHQHRKRGQPHYPSTHSGASQTRVRHRIPTDPREPMEPLALTTPPTVTASGRHKPQLAQTKMQHSVSLPHPNAIPYRPGPIVQRIEQVPPKD